MAHLLLLSFGGLMVLQLQLQEVIIHVLCLYCLQCLLQVLHSGPAWVTKSVKKEKIMHFAAGLIYCTDDAHDWLCIPSTLSAGPSGIVSLQEAMAVTTASWI